jgi:hypothetical protein
MSALPNLINYQEPLLMMPPNTTNRLVACVPTGSGSFGPSSQIQLDLGNSGFLDPASLCFRYKITYTTQVLAGGLGVPATPAYVPLQRFETLVNSTSVEQINNYNVVANMLTNLRLSVSEKYGQQAGLGYEVIALPSTPAVPSLEQLDGFTSTNATTATTVTRYYSAPLHGLLSGSEKLIPLFLLNNIRLIFSLDTVANIQSALAAQATAITDFSISNFEVVYNCIDFGREVEQEIIMMNPKIRLKSQSFFTGMQQLASGTSGTINLVYNARFASVKSAFLICGGGNAAISANRLYDAYDITSQNGDYQLSIGSNLYPQKALSTVNNRSGLLTELRRAMGSIYDKNVSMSINGVEFDALSNEVTSIVQPCKHFIGFNLQTLTVAQKAFFTGVSTQNAPITAIVNIGTATAQIHNIMLVLNYDSIMEIDSSTKQLVLIQ